MEAERRSAFQWFVSQAFGSDELTPYTAEYAWNSNQMAHAMMGFCLAACWLLFAVSLKPKPTGPAPADGPNPPAPGPAPADATGPNQTRGPLAGFLGWTRKLPLDVFAVVLFALIPVKEAVDLLLDGANYADSPVKPNIWRLVFDSVTDISFWWTGMFLAATAIGWFVRGSYRTLIPLGGLVACIGFWYFVAAPVWLNQKRTFDKSGMPFNYTRLAVLPGERDGPRKVTFAPASPTQWADLEGLRNSVVESPRPPQAHYVLFGGHPDVRSRLAVSMGCEFAFKLRWGDTGATGDDLVRVRYLSAATALERPKLLEQFALARLECVVVDHLDVTMDRPSDRRPERYLPALEAEARANPNKSAVVSGRLLEKHKLGRWASLKPQPQAGNGDAVQLTTGDIEEIKREVAATAPVGPPAPPTPKDDRLNAIIQIGGKAKQAGVSTIWVLTGFDGGLNVAAHTDWERRKTAWISEIALILDVDPGTLKLIELTEPPR